MLRVDGVAKRLAGRWVLTDVGFEVAAGEVAGVTGPNGAGKSTLLALIAGVTSVDRGRITVDGAAAGTVAAQRALGFVPEAANPPGHLTCDEVVALVAAIKRTTLAPAVRDALGLDHLAAHRIDRMSLGERRRTCLGAALVGTPRLLVLDEPTNGLDAAGVEVLVRLLVARAAAGAALVVASHDAGFLDRLDARRIALAEGRMVA
ncbi:MAG: ABC transporter ATP-binding protein [Kofleriaceae bacterium]|nr:ABC transporter ATP-binding protein [Kofleriaceae bacterium]MCB9574341.1 ABC transporter ATP-binding protein [Kofleriaceae bacterium]